MTAFVAYYFWLCVYFLFSGLADFSAVTTKNRCQPIFSGERGIRTLGTLLTYTRFPSVLLKPLGHLSVDLLAAFLLSKYLLFFVCQTILL